MQPVPIMPDQTISQIVSVSPPHQHGGQEFNYPQQQMGGQMPPQVFSSKLWDLSMII